jgi:selenocysteine-specific elongation factor
METVGGGIILDICPSKWTKERGLLAEFLKRLESFDLSEFCLAQAVRNGKVGITEGRLLAETLVEREQLLTALEALAQDGKVILLARNPHQIMEAEAMQELSRQTLQALKSFHQLNPLAAGLSREQLASSLFSNSPAAAFKLTMDRLAEQDQIVVDQDLIRLKGQEVTLNAQETASKKQIEETLRQAGWKMPSLEEVLAGTAIPEALARRFVMMLTKENKLLKVADGLYIHAEAIDLLKRLLAEQKKKNEKIDVGQFKALTDISRKYAIPLLEFLDREKITRRMGDHRLIL